MFKKEKLENYWSPPSQSLVFIDRSSRQISMSVIRLTSELYTRLIDLTGNEIYFGIFHSLSGPIDSSAVWHQKAYWYRISRQ